MGEIEMTTTSNLISAIPATMEELTVPISLTGAESAEGLRERTDYEATEKKMQTGGLTEEVKNETPPVAINLALLRQEPTMMTKLQKEFAGKSVTIAVLGIATATGIRSILDFITESAGAKDAALFAVDINPNILHEVDALGIHNVIALHEDARNTSIASEVVDLVIRDHVGNCCPPNIDRAMDREAVRILRSRGLSITNITTSELLTQSENRTTVPFSQARETLGDNLITLLQDEIFDLQDFQRIIGKDPEAIRGLLVEIEPDESFAIFGSGQSDREQQIDMIGHGEWFRRFDNHIALWKEHGFIIEDIRSRSGLDSHVPKLQCLRHIVLLRKGAV